MQVNNFVIAAAQSSSVRGALDENISTHLRLIGVAASVGVNLIVFPELSAITHLYMHSQHLKFCNIEIK